MSRISCNFSLISSFDPNSDKFELEAQIVRAPSLPGRTLFDFDASIALLLPHILNSFIPRIEAVGQVLGAVLRASVNTRFADFKSTSTGYIYRHRMLYTVAWCPGYPRSRG